MDHQGNKQGRSNDKEDKKLDPPLLKALRLVMVIKRLSLERR